MPDTTPLTDDQVAALWVAYEETGSYRAVSKQLGISDTTVARYCRRDPIRLHALVAARADARAERFREIEEKAITEMAELLEVLSKARAAVSRSGRGGMTRKEQFREIPRVLSSIQRVAGDAATKVQLLTGGATERVGAETGAGIDGANLDDAQLIELVEEFGMDLPPGLRDRLDRARAAQEEPPPPKRKTRKKTRTKKKTTKKRGQRR